MKSIKGLGLMSWLGGVVMTVFSGNELWFTCGLFLGLALFALDDWIDHLFKPY
ncbi:MAG: hypothetical protein ACRCUH_15065 [Shewanella sp.]